MIQSIEIKGLRGIKEGKLENFTPLVVLVGPNGCGKSTVLDALFIGASPATGDAIGRSVRRRFGVQRGARWLLWRGNPNSKADIVVTTQDGKIRQCRLRPHPQAPESQILSTVSQKEISNSNSYDIGTLLTEFQEGNEYSKDSFFQPLPDVPNMGIIEPREYAPPVPLHQLHTKTAEQGRLAEVTGIIREVVPGLSDIRILTEGDAPLVYLLFEDYAIPVAMAGDGVQSLLRLSFELGALSGGVALMEEPEVHQHPGALRQTAKAILAAIRRDIQVIISTHSLELIDMLLSEAKDDTELQKLSVFRLQLKDGCLMSYQMPGMEVAFARTEIEDDLR